MPARLRIRIAAFATVLCALWLSCVTPSVPIPPPSPEQMVFELDAQEGTAVFQFDAEISYSNAIVYVFNRTAGEGIITTADDRGAVGPTPPLPAVVGDEMVITFEVETQLGSTCVVLREGRQSSGDRCEL